jgi:regulator of RNase E activity RraA
MKVAVVYDGRVRQVLDIDDLSQLPDVFTFEVDGVQVTKQRNEVKLLKVNTDVQVGDVYVPGKGIFRFVGA